MRNLILFLAVAGFCHTSCKTENQRTLNSFELPVNQCSYDTINMVVDGLKQGVWIPHTNADTLVYLNDTSHSVTPAITSGEIIRHLKKGGNKKLLALANGIDLSHYQGDEVDYLNKKSDQLSFVICKATEGLEYIDPDFKNNWDMIKNKGFTRGAYHFYHCADSPEKQAQFFLTVIGNITKADFPLIVDFEENSIDKSCKKSDIQKNLLIFLQLLKKETGRQPIIYTDLNTGNAYLNDETLSSYPLWIANYNGEASPTQPSVWKNKRWTLWQKTSSYKLGDNVNDLDIYNGNLIEFRTFIANQ